MQSRMPSVIALVPDALKGLYAVGKAAKAGGLPETTAILVHLRASQINGCSFCCQMHFAELRKMGESDDRLSTVAAWREAPYFTDAERAALALAEAVTRIADRPDPVSDEVWAEAARHYDEKALSSLLLEISLINVWNRLNVAIQQPAGAAWK